MIVTNIPTPYRIPLWDELSKSDDLELTVVFSASRESDRHWELPDGSFRQLYLRTWTVPVKGRFIHFSAGVWDALRDVRPDVIITTGYNPPQLVAFLYAIYHRLSHIAQTDGTLLSERHMSILHRAARLVIIRASRALVYSSEGGRGLLKSYGARDQDLFHSPLAVDNDLYGAVSGTAPAYDLIFVGRLVRTKNASFAITVAEHLATRLGRRVTLAIVGDGPERQDLEAQATQIARLVAVTFTGFAQQDGVASRLRASKVLLFPTRWDPWGLVANEASAAGIPTIVTPHAGCAGELIVDQVSGLVLPLDVESWSRALQILLTNDERRAALGLEAQRRVKSYTFSDASSGLRNAVIWATIAG